jgi:hypothetical protein
MLMKNIRQSLHAEFMRIREENERALCDERTRSANLAVRVTKVTELERRLNELERRLHGDQARALDGVL